MQKQNRIFKIYKGNVCFGLCHFEKNFLFKILFVVIAYTVGKPRLVYIGAYFLGKMELMNCMQNGTPYDIDEAVFQLSIK